MKEQLISFLNEHSEQSYTVEELAKQLSLKGSKNFVKLVKMIAKLEEQGKIQFNNDGRISIMKVDVYVTGTFRANERGFGFVSVDGWETDVFIPKNSVGTALNNDEVKIDIMKPAKGLNNQLAEGKIVEVVSRKQQFITGVVTKVGYKNYYAICKPTDKKLANYPVYLQDQGLHPQKDEVCQIEIVNYPSTKHPNIIGIATSILGHKDDPGVDILTIVENYDIPIEFPEDVLTEANEIPEEITDIESNRQDLRNRMIVTIDGESAKDLDDAVEVHKLQNGNYFLGVHIADVSYYVTDNSALDKEAYNRGTSVYLTDRVIPMLPRRLSNGICSLNPKVSRYTISCEMEINSEGQVVNYQIFPSVIKTAARMTYTAVNNILNDQDSSDAIKYYELVPMFLEMEQLHNN